MARAIYRILTFGCLTCGTEQKQGCWMYTDEYDQHKDTPFPNTCTNAECKDPHITYIPRKQTLAQVRESQRCAVYVYPDGDYSAPWTNDPNDEQARIAREAGGVRMEFTSIREMQEFQRKQGYRNEDKWLRVMDEGGYDISSPDFKQMREAMYKSGRNMVLDYDQKSIRERQDLIFEDMKKRREQHEESIRRFKSLKVGRAGDAQRYERLRRGNR